VKPHRRIVDGARGGVVDGADVEVPIAGIDGAAQRNLVAELPTVLLRQPKADDAKAG